MTNVQKNGLNQALSLADHTNEIFADLPVFEGEQDSVIVSNVITIKFKNFNVSVVVGYSDDKGTIYDKVIQEVKNFYENEEGRLNREREEYECPSITQGYAFDSLTC